MLHLFTDISIINSYWTRFSSKKNYFIPRCNTELRKKTLKIVRPKFWAAVPHDLKNYSLSTFSTLYIKYLIAQY